MPTKKSPFGFMNLNKVVMRRSRGGGSKRMLLLCQYVGVSLCVCVCVRICL